MMTMLEKAARALYELGRPPKPTAEHWSLDWSELADFDREKYRRQARAVLMAVREEMMDEKNGKAFNRSSAATIDTILNEDSAK